VFAPVTVLLIGRLLSSTLIGTRSIRQTRIDCEAIFLSEPGRAARKVVSLITEFRFLYYDSVVTDVKT
jgi:hypothetical protein